MKGEEIREGEMQRAGNDNNVKKIKRERERRSAEEKSNNKIQ